MISKIDIVNRTPKTVKVLAFIMWTLQKIVGTRECPPWKSRGQRPPTTTLCVYVV